MTNPVTFQRWAGISLLGRVLLSAIFIISGLSKIGNFGATRDLLVSHGVPVAGLFVFLSLVIEVAAGVLVLIGLQGRISAMILMAYLIPVTLVMHNFWAYVGPEHQMQLVNFLKNISIMGGLSQIAAMGPGPISIDQSRYHRGWSSDARDPSSRLRRVS
ncbi:MAG: DoxX family protein [Bdellovibrionia bacterium]